MYTLLVGPKHEQSLYALLIAAQRDAEDNGPEELAIFYKDLQEQLTRELGSVQPPHVHLRIPASYLNGIITHFKSVQQLYLKDIQLWAQHGLEHPQDQGKVIQKLQDLSTEIRQIDNLLKEILERSNITTRET